MAKQRPKQRPKSQQKKSKSKGQNQNKKKQQGKKASSDLYDPRTLLTGKDLKKMARSQADLELDPEINAAQRYASTLEELLNKQVKQQGALGQQASGNISTYYRDLATQEANRLAGQQAIGKRLGAEVGVQGAQAQGSQRQVADASLKRLDADDELRQQMPSSARDELQAMIVAQEGRRSTESQALQGNASLQSAGWEGLLQGQANASQMQGGAIMSDTNRQILNSISDIRSEFNPEITDARGSIKDLRGSRGDLTRQILMELRGGERDFALSKGALGIDKDALKQESKLGKANPQLAVAKQYGKNKRREQMRSLRNQLKVAEKQGANKKAEQLRSRISQLEVIAAQQGNKGTGKSKGYSPAKYRRAKDLATARLNIENIDTRDKYNQAVAALVNGGADPEAIRAYLKKVSPYWKKKKGGGSSVLGNIATSGLATAGSVLADLIGGD